MRIETHELLEFRRIAAYLYKKNKRWQQSVSLSKADKMYKDAIDTAAESQDGDLVEELLRFFVSVQDKACFAAVLYTCYDHVSCSLCAFGRLCAHSWWAPSQMSNCWWGAHQTRRRADFGDASE